MNLYLSFCICILKYFAKLVLVMRLHIKQAILYKKRWDWGMHSALLLLLGPVRNSVEAQVGNPSMWEVGAGFPWLHKEVKVNLNLT